jgi:hypothetical protein
LGKEGDVSLIIISLLMSLMLGHRLFLGIANKEKGHNPREPSAGWWVLTTANTAGTNGLTCLPKHGGALDDRPMLFRCISKEKILIIINYNNAINNIRLK